LLFDGEFETPESGGGGWCFANAKLLVAEAHYPVIVLVLSAVHRKEVVELVQEFLRPYVDGELIANVVLAVELKRAPVVGRVDNHHALPPVSSGHIGDVERLAFGAFVAHKGAERLYDMVGVAPQLFGNIVGLHLAPCHRAGGDGQQE